MEVFQAGGGVCGRETPSGGNTGMLAFPDHLHAQKPITYKKGKTPKSIIEPLQGKYLNIVQYLSNLLIHH